MEHWCSGVLENKKVQGALCLPLHLAQNFQIKLLKNDAFTEMIN